MSLFSDLPGDEGLPGVQRRRAMLAVMTATTMAVFDGTVSWEAGMIGPAVEKWTT